MRTHLEAIERLRYYIGFANVVVRTSMVETLLGTPRGILGKHCPKSACSSEEIYIKFVGMMVSKR